MVNYSSLSEAAGALRTAKAGGNVAVAADAVKFINDMDPETYSRAFKGLDLGDIDLLKNTPGLSLSDDAASLSRLSPAAQQASKAEGSIPEIVGQLTNGKNLPNEEVFKKAGEAASETEGVSKRLKSMWETTKSNPLTSITLAALTALFIYNFILEEGNISEALKQTASDAGAVVADVAQTAGETGGALLGSLFEGLGIWFILFGVFALLLLIIIL